jgi:hypothetical protein
MKVNRLDLLASLDAVRPAVGINALVPKYQTFNFCKGRVQATNGAMWINAPLPEGWDTDMTVVAEPFYRLISSMSQEQVTFELQDTGLVVSAGRVKGEFVVGDAVDPPLPAVNNILSQEQLGDLLQGLDFCQYGASRDETMGTMCGVKVKDDSVWATDRYRILHRQLKSSIGIDCSIPVQLVQYLLKVKNDIEAFDFHSGENSSGVLYLKLEDDVYVWGYTLTGEYRDLSQFFPKDDSGELIELPSEFVGAIEKHLSFIREVPTVDKAVLFTIGVDSCTTFSQKLSSISEVERTLSEEITLSSSRSGESFQFRINPVLLKDAMGVCWKFKFFPDATVVLFETEDSQYLVQTIA